MLINANVRLFATSETVVNCELVVSLCSMAPVKTAIPAREPNHLHF